MARELYRRARMRAVREPAPTATVKTWVRKLLARAEMLSDVSPPMGVPNNIQYVFWDLRKMARVLQRRNPSFSALRGAVTEETLLFARPATPKNNTDAEYVLSVLRAIDTFLTKFARAMELSNAALAARARARRAERAGLGFWRRRGTESLAGQAAARRVSGQAARRVSGQAARR